MTELEKVQMLEQISPPHIPATGELYSLTVVSTEESKFFIHHRDIRLTLEKHLSENSSLSALRWSYFRSITFVFFIFSNLSGCIWVPFTQKSILGKNRQNVSLYDSHFWVPEMGSGSLVWHGVLVVPHTYVRRASCRKSFSFYGPLARHLLSRKLLKGLFGAWRSWEFWRLSLSSAIWLGWRKRSCLLLVQNLIFFTCLPFCCTWN